MNIESLRQQCSGAVLLPDTHGYDEMRRCWNTAVNLYPAVIVVASTAADIQAALAFANHNSLNVLVQSTGHGAAPQTGHYLLIVTTRMRRVVVDAAGRTAWIEAGAVWGDVLRETQLHGLAPLLGSSGTVGVIGYTLGGGIGWLARKYGLAVDSVVSIELVTADGQMVRASSREHRDLYWAMCGSGGGGFGIVAAIEVQLYPVSTVWGGGLTYPIAQVTEVFSRYREWTTSLPEAMTSSIAIVNVPDRSDIPPTVRGTSFVIVKGCCCGPVSDGKALMSHWTDWKRPTTNTFAVLPFAEVASISQDPVDPVPAFAAGGDVLRTLSDEAIAIVIQYATVDGTTNSGTSLFLETEVRHVDSEVVRAQRTPNAYSLRDASFILDVVASAPTPESIDALRRYTAAFKRALRPHSSGTYLNFADAAVRTDNAFDAETDARLRAIKHRYDARGLFISADPFR
ncbi:MAG TPA: FAD-dependent oxidoreductase [Gemmatimonadaceae bacterium]|nr:FAD-dependent oxidoreductase [Gemmatimonadaceae bacterium]